jgi:hypothetical protein
LTDRYFKVNPSIGRRPGGIFLDERPYLSTVKYQTWVVRHKVSGGVQFGPFSVLSTSRDSCHKCETVTG